MPGIGETHDADNRVIRSDLDSPNPPTITLGLSIFLWCHYHSLAASVAKIMVSIKRRSYHTTFLEMPPVACEFYPVKGLGCFPSAKIYNSLSRSALHLCFLPQLRFITLSFKCPWSSVSYPLDISLERYPLCDEKTIEWANITFLCFRPLISFIHTRLIENPLSYDCLSC